MTLNSCRCASIGVFSKKAAHTPTNWPLRHAAEHRPEYWITLGNEDYSTRELCLPPRCSTCGIFSQLCVVDGRVVLRLGCTHLEQIRSGTD